jgi:Family of unknown function (DUF6156)
MGRRHRGPPGQIVYYAGWAGLSMPRVPTDPISAAEAMGRQTYYRAEYDEDGRLARFAKFLGDVVMWADSYSYWTNGRLRNRTMRKDDGSEISEDYDRHGRLVR